MDSGRKGGKRVSISVADHAVWGNSLVSARSEKEMICLFFKGCRKRGRSFSSRSLRKCPQHIEPLCVDRDGCPHPLKFWYGLNGRDFLADEKFAAALQAVSVRGTKYRRRFLCRIHLWFRLSSLSFARYMNTKKPLSLRKFTV